MLGTFTCCAQALNTHIDVLRLRSDRRHGSSPRSPHRPATIRGNGYTFHMLTQCGELLLQRILLLSFESCKHLLSMPMIQEAPFQWRGISWLASFMVQGNAHHRGTLPVCIGMTQARPQIKHEAEEDERAGGAPALGALERVCHKPQNPTCKSHRKEHTSQHHRIPPAAWSAGSCRSQGTKSTLRICV